MASVSVGASTIGFLDFDDLCRGNQKCYSYNLMDTSKQPNFSELIEKLKTHLKDTMTSIEIQSDRKILEYKIGKSHARSKFRTVNGVKQFKPFNVMDVRTWKLAGGVNGRWWNTYFKENYDGLVALCAFTSSEIPYDLNDVHSPEECALSVEGQMIRDHIDDRRCTNKRDNSTGDKSNPPAKAGVVYVAYKLEAPLLDDDAGETSVGDIEMEEWNTLQSPQNFSPDIQTSFNLAYQQQTKTMSPSKQRESISPTKQTNSAPFSEQAGSVSPARYTQSVSSSKLRDTTSPTKQTKTAPNSDQTRAVSPTRQMQGRQTNKSGKKKNKTSSTKQSISPSKQTKDNSFSNDARENADVIQSDTRPGPSNTAQNSLINAQPRVEESYYEPKRKVCRMQKNKPSSISKTSEDPTNILKTGCMPWCPPARREWGSECLSLPGGIQWPPEGWKEFETDRKLLVLEYTIVKLESLKKSYSPMSLYSRINLLNKYNFLVLPGTEMPSRTENHNMGVFYNYEILRKIALGQSAGVDTTFFDMMRAASENRDNSTDDILDVITDVPLQLNDSLLQ